MTTVQLRLPDEVLADARHLATTDNLDLDEFVANALAKQIEARKGIAYLRERGRRGDREKFLAVLSEAPNVPPVPGDELD